MLTKTIWLCTNVPQAQPSVKAYQCAKPRKKQIPIHLKCKISRVLRNTNNSVQKCSITGRFGYRSSDHYGDTKEGARL